MSIATRRFLKFASETIPPLEPGDHLTRDEFERRYEAMPELKKAELIEGVVYMAAAVRWDNHAGPHADLMTWLGVYRASTPGVLVGDNGSIRLDLDNEPQPDGTMLIGPKFGGKAVLSKDDYVEGAPEFVAEISGSNVSLDMNKKMRVYLRNGVQEYLVWRVYDGEIDWFSLRQGQYERLAADAGGIVRSGVFPGLWLDARAMVEGRLIDVLKTLQEGIGSAEHGAFLGMLRSRSGNQ